MVRKALRSYIVPHLLHTLFSKRETIHYPQGKLELPTAYRGAVEVDIAKCGGCGLCARDCPSGAMGVTHLPGGGVRVELDYGACAECGQCELSCHRHAIHLEPRFRDTTANRNGMTQVWERDKRDANS